VLKIISVLALTLVIGCAGLSNEPTFTETPLCNQIDAGSYRIEIDTSFELADTVSGKRRLPNVDVQSSATRHTRYLLVQGRHNIDKGIIVTITDLVDAHHFFRTEASFSSWDAPGILERGYRDAGEVKCAYCVRKVSPFGRKIGGILEKKGYSMADCNCAMEVRYAKNAGRSRWLSVIYFEGMPVTGADIGSEEVERAIRHADAFIRISRR
jgi:hypothetical protein